MANSHIGEERQGWSFCVSWNGHAACQLNLPEAPNVVVECVGSPCPWKCMFDYCDARRDPGIAGPQRCWQVGLQLFDVSEESY